MLATRNLGTEGLAVSDIGLGCMGMSFAYGPGERDDNESIKTIHRALELGCTFFDTAEAYGPVHERRAARPRARRQTRSSRDRDEVRLHVWRRRRGERHRQPARARARSGRRIAAPSEHRSHRFALSASLGSERADRRNGRRDGRTRARRQSALSRTLGSRRRDDSPRAFRASDLRAAKRVFALGAQSRADDHSAACANSASASCPLRRSAAAS